MTIVELIDTHDGFAIIHRNIRTKNKIGLLWILSLLTFFLSAVLDNLTTTIVMVAIIKKILGTKEDLWTFAGFIIISWLALIWYLSGIAVLYGAQLMKVAVTYGIIGRGDSNACITIPKKQYYFGSDSNGFAAYRSRIKIPFNTIHYSCGTYFIE